MTAPARRGKVRGMPRPAVLNLSALRRVRLPAWSCRWGGAMLTFTPTHARSGSLRIVAGDGHDLFVGRASVMPAPLTRQLLANAALGRDTWKPAPQVLVRVAVYPNGGDVVGYHFAYTHPKDAAATLRALAIGAVFALVAEVAETAPAEAAP